MDALRSCYTTTMRFPGVGLVPVRWYWTDKPPLPLEHVYGSHNHSRSQGWEDYDTGEPGEVWGATRKFYNGASPVGCPCVTYRGDENAWLGVSDSTSPLYPSCIWGFAFDLGFSAGFDSETYANGLASFVE
jgi:hypothetical protein